MVVYFELFWNCLQSTSYILVETVLRPAAAWPYHGYWDWCEEEIAGINNPHLAAAASDSVTVAALKLLTESHPPLVSSTDFDNLSSAVGLALNLSKISTPHESKTAKFCQHLFPIVNKLLTQNARPLEKNVLAKHSGIHCSKHFTADGWRWQWLIAYGFWKKNTDRRQKLAGRENCKPNVHHS